MKQKMVQIWTHITHEAKKASKDEPLLASFLYETVLRHETFEGGLSSHLSRKLEAPQVDGVLIRNLIQEAFTAEPEIPQRAARDLDAIFSRDPAASSYALPFLFFKGFHALQGYRIGHWLWNRDRKILASFFQSRISELFGVDIHPAARIGAGILIDHATGVVVGETAVIEDNVSLLHEVTLGGTGKETGDRHPKVREGVLIGAGAKILGNIEVGKGAKVGAGSVVLKPVPPHAVVAGVPSKLVGMVDADKPSLSMDHLLPLSDDHDFQI